METYPEPGYEVDHLENYEQRFKCIFCHFIMRNPVQLTECGHRLCQTCLDAHLPVGSDGYIICPFQDCNTRTLRSQIRLDKAFKRDVHSLTVTCMHHADNNCDWSGPLKDYETHISENHSRFTCNMCNETLHSRHEFLKHQQSTCPALFSRCPLNPQCGTEMIRLEHYLSHLLDPQHQDALVRVLTGRSKISPPPLEERDMESIQEELEIRDIIINNFTDLNNRIEKTTKSTAMLLNEYEDQKKNIEGISADLRTLLNKTQESKVSILDYQENQRRLQEKIDALSSIVNHFEPVSTNGSLIWKVRNVSELIADAQSERCTSIMSPIFYSSSNGYKLRLRLFPFGDGVAHRTHMSLFIMILKGDYDPILTWPFKYRITFCLLDQTGSKHIVDSFQPDVKSNSFQRPKTNSNTPNGIPKFVPLSTLQPDNNEYVREDTMFIQVFVDMTGTLMSTPTWIMKLNCALPLHLQETSMRRESLSNSQATPRVITEMHQ